LSALVFQYTRHASVFCFFNALIQRLDLTCWACAVSCLRILCEVVSRVFLTVERGGATTRKGWRVPGSHHVTTEGSIFDEKNSNTQTPSLQHFLRRIEQKCTKFTPAQGWSPSEKLAYSSMSVEGIFVTPAAGAYPPASNVHMCVYVKSDVWSCVCRK
jgi:hypothetical protein